MGVFVNKLSTMLVLSALALSFGTLEAAWGSSNGQKANAQMRGGSTSAKGSIQNILFIQTAREAVIERDLGEARGTYSLTLKGVQPNLAYFGDQPQRLAGKVPLDTFLNDWSRGRGVMSYSGAAGGLNGALVTTSTTPSNVTDVSESLIILSEPSYDARTQELKFTIRNMSGTKLQIGRHSNPILFIDNN